ncbi:MAG TPA: hypothetical protein VI248_08260 [Kineosporiaceae bacterium]
MHDPDVRPSEGVAAILREAGRPERYLALLSAPAGARPDPASGAAVGRTPGGPSGEEVGPGEADDTLDGVAAELAAALAVPASGEHVGAGSAHPLRRAPAQVLRPASGVGPGADTEARYLAHSCDLVLNGGLATALAAPLTVCALAEHYALRRVGGSSAAGAVAAAAAAAELGRTAAELSRTAGEPDDADDCRVRPGFAGLADAIAWLAAEPRPGIDPSDAAQSRPGQSHRLARMFRPADDAVELHRLVTAAIRPGTGRFPGRAVRVTAAVLAGLDRATWTAVGLLWLGSAAGCAGLVAALARSAEVNHLLVPVAAVPLAVTFTLAACLGTALLAGHPARAAVRDALATDGWGLVSGADPAGADPTDADPSVSHPAAADPPRPGRLERLAGVLDPDGVPHLGAWLADRIDDLAGVPPATPGAKRYALTFGDLWLGRLGRRTPAEIQALRNAAVHPRQRVVDLVLLTTDVSRGRPYLLPFGTATRPEEARTAGYLFCRTCLVAVLPARVTDQLVLLSSGDPAGAPRCPRHPGELLHDLPEPWDLPVAFAVRLSAAAPGLLRAVPLHRADGGPDQVRTHWFCDGALAGGLPAHTFDVPLPLWPTFSIGTHPDPGEEISVPDLDAEDLPPPWRPAPGAAGLATAVLAAVGGWRDALRVAPGTRGRSALVRGSALGTGPFLPDAAVRELAARGHRAGVALRDRFTGADAGSPVHTGTDRYRWVRMRAALTEFRRLSLAIDAGVPLYTDLALNYRVPPGLVPWFSESFEAGGRDPAWGDAVAAITHLRSLAQKGVLDWDTDWGTPPPDPHLRLG